MRFEPAPVRDPRLAPYYDMTPNLITINKIKCLFINTSYIIIFIYFISYPIQIDHILTFTVSKKFGKQVRK